MRGHPVAFIVGFGKGVGASVAARFKAGGFSIAVASRSLPPDVVMKQYGYLGLKLDMAKPEDVPGAFEEVEKILAPPSLVVYNVGAYAAAPGGRSDPLSMTFEDFQYGAAVSGVNAYEVAKYANLGFDKLPHKTPRTFIATGNALPWIQPPLPHVLGLSSGKKVLANIVESCAIAYGPVGKRFYYASEVSKTGGLVRSPDPETHASVFWRLYHEAHQGSWDVRFSKGDA